LGLLEDLLDNLLLLDQESADDTVLDAVGASRSTVRTLDGLLGAGDGGIFAGSEGRDTGELGTAVLEIVRKKNFRGAGLGLTYTALGSSALLLDVEVTELATGGLQCLSAGHRGMCASMTDLDNANLLALGVVRRATPLRIVSLHATFLSSLPSEWKTCVSGHDVRR
jgi:hypothetical protein